MGEKAGKKTRLGILASGSGTNLQRFIDACRSADFPAEVAAVVSDRSDAYALTRARRHGIPAVYVGRRQFSSSEEFNEAILEVLVEHKVDLVVMAGYMRLLGSAVLRAFPGRVLNIHPALLPSFPGAHGVPDALEYGAKVAGVSIHFADERFDTGPIIFQEAAPVLENDTVETLHDRIHELEYRLYPLAVKYWAEGRLSIRGRRVRINGDWRADAQSFAGWHPAD